MLLCYQGFSVSLGRRCGRSSGFESTRDEDDVTTRIMERSVRVSAFPLIHEPPVVNYGVSRQELAEQAVSLTR